MEQSPKQENQENKEKVIEYEVIQDIIFENNETKHRNLKGLISPEFANEYIETHKEELENQALKIFPGSISSQLRVEPKEIWIDKRYSSPEEEAFEEKIKELNYEPVGYGIPEKYDINNPLHSNPDGTIIYDGNMVYVNEVGQYADAFYFRDLFKK